MKDKVTQDERVIFKDNGVQVKQAVNESVSQTYTNSKDQMTQTIEIELKDGGS